jgi:threonine/homoserine/homoserine lactone efflux protein
MVSLEQLFGFGVTAFVLIVIPGPSVVFVVGRALAYGRGVALASVLGNSIGFLVILGLVAVGLGVVVQESVVAYTVVKLAGAAYLVYLGVQAARHRRGFVMTDAASPPCRCAAGERCGRASWSGCPTPKR